MVHNGAQLQAQVEDTLRRLADKQHTVIKEPIDGVAGYALDLVLAPAPDAQGGAARPTIARDGGASESGVREGQLVGEEVRDGGVVIEVDGPAHFLRPGGRLIRFGCS